MSSSTSSPSIALVTGGTGFVGSAIALEFLRQGYNVRLAVRKSSDIDLWKSKYPEFGDRVSFVVIEDFVVPGAFDEALKGVTYVAHAASPTNFAPEDSKRDVIDPAINNNLNLLKSAKKVSSVKSIVLTSSIVAYINPLEKSPGSDVTIGANNWNPITYEQGIKFTKEQGGLTYSASKVLAERAALDWVKAEKPNFTLSIVAPAFVLGHNSQPQLDSWADVGKASTWGWTVKDLIDATSFPSAALRSYFINVLDVARAHVGAVTNPSVSSGKRYLLAGGRYNHEEAARFAAKAVPELKQRFNHTDGAPFSDLFKVDASDAEKDFGFKYIDLEETMASWAKQVFSLPTTAQQKL